jgi:hypothetical protein
MQNVVEDIHRGINEIRDLLGPMNLKLENLDQKISENSISFQSKWVEFEAKIAAHTLRISEQAIKSDDHSRQIASLFERIRWMEATLNVPKRPEKTLENLAGGQTDVTS